MVRSVDDIFRGLYDDTWADVLAYCRRRCATEADAEDVVAETFAIAWRRLGELPHGSAARPWLFGVARNLLRDHYRRGDWVEEVTERLINELVTSSDTTVNSESVRNDVAVVIQALKLLDEPDREVIQLIAWDQLSRADAGVVLGCSENAVKIRLHRARSRLTVKVAQLTSDPTDPKTS